MSAAWRRRPIRSPASYYVERLTDQLEGAANEYLAQIDAMGGALAAIEAGYQQRQIQEAAYRVQREIESGDQVVVGVNRFRDDEIHTPDLQRIDPHAEQRAGRAGAAVARRA